MEKSPILLSQYQPSMDEPSPNSPGNTLVADMVPWQWLISSGILTCDF